VISNRLPEEQERSKARTCFGTLLWFVVASLAGAAAGDDEQWLQFRTSTDVLDEVAHIGWRDTALDGRQPEGLDLPELPLRQRLFAKWQTPMAKAGFLWVVLNHNKTARPLRGIYIDTDCDGSLADEQAVPPVDHAERYQAKILFQGEHGRFQYYLNIGLRTSEENQPRALWVQAGCWNEGDVVIGGRKYHCLLIDFQADGVFNSTSMTFHDLDLIKLRESDGKYVHHFVGKYIEVADVLYELDVPADGAYIKVTPAENVPTGTLRISKDIDGFTFGGEMGSFHRFKADVITSAPAGKHRLGQWWMYREDSEGNRWSLQGANHDSTGSEGVFDVHPEQETTLDIGEPVTAALQSEVTDQRYTFHLAITGRYHEPIEIKLNQEPIPEPTLHLTGRDGSYDKVLKFTRDSRPGSFSLSWRKPRTARGAFIATPEIASPFNIEIKPCEFEVE